MDYKTTDYKSRLKIYLKSLTTATLQNVEYRRPLTVWGAPLDNLGKDIRPVASGVAGVGDSAEVYVVKSYQLLVKLGFVVK